jgi:hypothetical protein
MIFRLKGEREREKLSRNDDDGCDDAPKTQLCHYSDFETISRCIHIIPISLPPIQMHKSRRLVGGVEWQRLSQRLQTDQHKKTLYYFRMSSDEFDYHIHKTN